MDRYEYLESFIKTKKDYLREAQKELTQEDILKAIEDSYRELDNWETE